MHTQTPPGLSAPSPIATLTQERDRLRSEYQVEQKDLLTRSRETHALRQRWELEGAPGGNFTVWLGGERGEHIPHGTIQDRLRSGEAQSVGITAQTDTEAQNAGRELRTLTGQGVPLAQAAEQVREKLSAGELKRKRAPGAPDGCTWRAVPLTVVDTLEALEQRLERVGVDVPSGSPERLATLINAVAGLPDEGLSALLGGGEHVLVKVSVLRDLMDRAGVSA